MCVINSHSNSPRDFYSEAIYTANHCLDPDVDINTIPDDHIELMLKQFHACNLSEGWIERNGKIAQLFIKASTWIFLNKFSFRMQIGSIHKASCENLLDHYPKDVVYKLKKGKVLGNVITLICTSRFFNTAASTEFSETRRELIKKYRSETLPVITFTEGLTKRTALAFIRINMADTALVNDLSVREQRELLIYTDKIQSVMEYKDFFKRVIVKRKSFTQDEIKTELPKLINFLEAEYITQL